MTTRQSDAAKVFIINRVVLSMADDIMYTLAAIYHITYFGLNPLQLVLIGTAHQVTVLLCEIPTGLISDLYSRRVSVIIGIFLIGSASLLMGLIPWMAETLLPTAFPLFSLLLIGEVIRGIGVTCISGSQEAWVTDEIGEKNTSAVFLQASQLAQVAGLFGMGISIALSSWALHLPFLLGAVVHVGLGFYALSAMRERNFSPALRSEIKLSGAIGDIFGSGIRAIRGKQVLMLLMIAAFFAGGASEGFDRLWEAHFLNTITLPRLLNLEPVFWFGLLNLGGKLFSIGALTWARQGLDTSTDSRVSRYLQLLSVLHLLLMLVFGLAPDFLVATIAFLAITVVVDLKRPLISVWINRHVESKVRATVLSMHGQMDAIGQTAGGPGLGLIGTATSLRVVMILVAGLLVPTAAVYGKALSQAMATEAEAA